MTSVTVPLEGRWFRWLALAEKLDDDFAAQQLTQTNEYAIRSWRTPTGRFIPSVTSALAKSGLTDYRYGGDEAMARGREVHRMLAEFYLNNGNVFVMDGFGGFMTAIEKFAAKTTFRAAVVEQAVVSVTHGYSGTLDLAGLLFDVDSLLDAKSVGGKRPTRPEPATEYQTAGYAMALVEAAVRVGEPWLRLPETHALVLADGDFAIYPWPWSLPSGHTFLGAVRTVVARERLGRL